MYASTFGVDESSSAQLEDMFLRASNAVVIAPARHLFRFPSAWASFARTLNRTHAGDFLRIERSSPVDGGGHNLSDRGGHALGSGTTVAKQEAGDPTSPPVARHATDAAGSPWRLVVGPCGQRSIGGAEDGDAGADGQGTERGMVLYNVATGAQLHAR